LIFEWGALSFPPFTGKRIHNTAKIMSQHPSFKAGSSGSKKRRNVLKRFERVSLLKKRGQWKEGDRVQGLRKTLASD